MVQGGLGRGLGALIPQKPVSQLSKEIGERVTEVSVDKIIPNRKQPRENFNAEALDDLMQSIAEHGILQPLVVVRMGDGYELIAGERRLRASKLLGMKTVPVIVRTATEQQKLELSLIENIQRESLNPIEEGKAYKMLIDEFNLEHQDIAKRVGKSRPVISNALRLLDLPDHIQQALINGKISYSSARALLSLPEDEREKVFSQMMSGEKITSVDIAKKRAPQTRKEDPNLKAAETELRDALGTKVSIKRRGNLGTITIEFYSDEELRKILNILAS